MIRAISVRILMYYIASLPPVLTFCLARSLDFSNSETAQITLVPLALFVYLLYRWESLVGSAHKGGGQ